MVSCVQELNINTMPKYVYTYFDARARGEPGRMLFAAAGVPFQDRRLTQEEWPALKPSKYIVHKDSYM